MFLYSTIRKSRFQSIACMWSNSNLPSQRPDPDLRRPCVVSTPLSGRRLLCLINIQPTCQFSITNSVESSLHTTKYGSSKSRSPPTAVRQIPRQGPCQKGRRIYPQQRRSQRRYHLSRESKDVYGGGMCRFLPFVCNMPTIAGIVPCPLPYRIVGQHHD